MQTTPTTPAADTSALVANFIANGGTVKQCEPANAVPPSPQAQKTPARVVKAVKKAVAKTDAKKADAAKPAKAPRAKKAAAPAERATAVAGDVTLAPICADLGVNAKAARAVLRRHMTKPADGWSFDKATAKKVRALLTK